MSAARTADAAPRQLTRFALPISPGQDAHILVRWPMTQAEWNRIMVVLDAMKPALVWDDDEIAVRTADAAPQDQL